MNCGELPLPPPPPPDPKCPSAANLEDGGCVIIKESGKFLREMRLREGEGLALMGKMRHFPGRASNLNLCQDLMRMLVSL